MGMSREGLLRSLKALLIRGIRLAIEYDEGHPDFPMTSQHMDNFAKRWLMHSLLWSFSGSASWKIRSELTDLLVRSSGIILPENDGNSCRELEPWSDSVPRMKIESHKVSLWMSKFLMHCIPL